MWIFYYWPIFVRGPFLLFQTLDLIGIWWGRLILGHSDLFSYHIWLTPNHLIVQVHQTRKNFFTHAYSILHVYLVL